ncbi:inactive hydroxysteroid dehydrogenase-like protein 1 [Petromyzon marinus]|uniref:Inactive hydroxysteroid dehydrogenase-like protein 1 n=1 Tax=Petromyzon marinus TaxID=7757 RepID=A0AAJ7U6Z6_PETMA|nr:inactive hydroxysteroid dehydrogenase-like protein 1 [Petromyzon marinus]
MATAVDSFALLWRELCGSLSPYQEALALLGALYAAGRALRALRALGGALRVHAAPRLLPLLRGAPPRSLTASHGTWAVVTGPTSGIGRAYARELARRGLGVVLVGRDAARLGAAAEELRRDFPVRTLEVVADFGRGPAAYGDITRALEGMDVGVLVNNVGVMPVVPGPFLSAGEEQLWQLVNVNMAAAMLMTRLLLPGMLERGRGAVVNVSSGSCLKPTPYMAAYAATKAFVESWSCSLSRECAGSGVAVQTLIPFYVATRMTAPGRFFRRPWLFVPSAEEYARHAVSTLGVARRTTGYWPHTLQMWIAQLMPEWLWAWFAMHINILLWKP